MLKNSKRDILQKESAKKRMTTKEMKEMEKIQLKKEQKIIKTRRSGLEIGEWRGGRK
jgi:hypothetical protein